MIRNKFNKALFRVNEIQEEKRRKVDFRYILANRAGAS